MLQGQPGQVVSIAEPVGRRVEVGAGVGDHGDAPDGELSAGSVMIVGSVKAEVLADLRAGKAGIGHHLVVNDVAEIYEAHAYMVPDAEARPPDESDPDRRPPYRRGIALRTPQKHPARTACVRRW